MFQDIFARVFMLHILYTVLKNKIVAVPIHEGDPQP